MSSMQTTPRLPKQQSELFQHLEQYNQRQQLRHIRMQSRFKKEQQRLEGVMFPATEVKKPEGNKMGFTNEVIKGGIERQTVMDMQRVEGSRTVSTDYQPDFFKLRRKSTFASPAKHLKPVDPSIEKNFNSRKLSFATPRSNFVNEFTSSAVEPSHAIRWVARKTVSRLQAQEMEIERIEKKIMEQEAVKREEYMREVLGKARRGEYIPEDQLVKRTPTKDPGSMSRTEQTPGKMSNLERLLSHVNVNVVIETKEPIPVGVKSKELLHPNSQEALVTTMAGSPPVNPSPVNEIADPMEDLNVATDSVHDSVQRSPFDASVQLAGEAGSGEEHPDDAEFLEQQYQTELKLFEAEASIQQEDDGDLSPGVVVPFTQTHKLEHATLPVSPRGMSYSPTRAAELHDDIKAQTTGSAAHFETRFTKGSKSNRQSSQRTVQSLLQHPGFSPEKDMPKMLDQYVTNFAGHLHEQFKKDLPLPKFRRALAREVSKGSFARGQDLMAQWTQKFEHKHRNKMYYHLQTLAKWREEEERKERERLEAEQRAQDSALSRDYQDSHSLRSEIMNKLGMKFASIQTEVMKEAKKEERAVRKKLDRGEKLTYNELTARAVSIQLPGIDQRYLMNNKTCIEPKSFRRQDALMLKTQRVNKKMAAARSKSKVAEGDDTSMLQTDSEVDSVEEKFARTGSFDRGDSDLEMEKSIQDFEEWIEKTYEETKSEELEERDKRRRENRARSPSTDVEIKRMITMAIYYEGAEFKALIDRARKTLRTFKSIKMRDADDAAEKRRLNQVMKRVYIRFMQRLLLQRKLFDGDFLKKRYGTMSPRAKHAKRDKDIKRYGAPVVVQAPDPEEVKHFLKLKLAPAIADELFDLSMDPQQRIQLALSPLKTGKVDTYVSKIIKDFVNESEDGRVSKMINKYRKSMRMRSAKPREADKRPEYQQLLYYTKEANYKLTGKDPPTLHILKDARKDFAFLEKLKKKMMLNSHMFIHEVGLDEDSEIRELAEEEQEAKRASQMGTQESDVGSMQSPSRMTAMNSMNPADSRIASAAPTPGVPPRRKRAKKSKQKAAVKPDIEMVFAQTCLDGKFTPVLSLLRKLMDRTQKNCLVVDIHDFKLIQGWPKIIHEVICDEKDFKYMVRKLILTNNLLTADNFSLILKALQTQEGLETIVYQENQLNEACVEQLEDFLANKNLEQLNMKSLVDTDEATVSALVAAIYCGSNLQRLDLINVKHMNAPEPFSVLLQSLVKLPDLKHLNLASNFLNQSQLADVVEAMANTRLVTFSLADNNMKPIFGTDGGRGRKKKDLGGPKLIKPCRTFYQTISFMLQEGNVQCLDLSQMQLGDEAIKRLAPSLIRNTSLTSLHLSNNGISKEAIADLRWQLSIVHKEGEPRAPSDGQLEKDAMRDTSPDLYGSIRSPSPTRQMMSTTGGLKGAAGKTMTVMPEIVEEKKSDTVTKQVSSVRGSMAGEIVIPRLENPYLPAKRVVSLDRPYTRGELPEDVKRDLSAGRLHVPLPVSANTKADPGKGIRQIHKNLFSNITMNLVNHQDKLALKRLERNTFGVQTPAGVRTRLLEEAELLGGRLILSRVLGHLEFEAVKKPVFSEARIAKTKFRLEEAERHKEEIEKYGGIIVGGKIVQPEPRPPSGQSEQEDEVISEFLPETDSMGATVMQSTLVGSRFEGNRAIIEELRAVKEARYNMPPLHMRWRITNDCHLCNKARYCLLFYQRSKAQIWFRELSPEDPADARLIGTIPQDALVEYRQRLDVLNRALMEPGCKVNTERPILDPLVCGNFATMKVKEFKNPHEYADRIIRQDILDDVTKSLAWKRSDLLTRFVKKPEKAEREYQKHFMVRYGERRRAAIEGQRWLQIIMKNLKYQYNTTFLNCPKALDLDEYEEKELDKAIKESDLFVTSFFLHSGRQDVVVLDCEYDPHKNAFMETYYTRQYLVPQMGEDPARPSETESAFLTEQMEKLGIYDKYEAIAAQNERDEAERLAIEKAKRRELEKLRQLAEAEKEAKLAAKKKAAKAAAAAGK